jgi:hypothetical protein
MGLESKMNSLFFDITALLLYNRSVMAKEIQYFRKASKA